MLTMKGCEEAKTKAVTKGILRTHEDWNVRIFWTRCKTISYRTCSLESKSVANSLNAQGRGRFGGQKFCTRACVTFSMTIHISHYSVAYFQRIIFAY